MSKKWMIAGAVSALITSAAFAQEQRRMIFAQAIPATGAAIPAEVMVVSGAGIMEGTAQFLSAEMSFEGPPVKGAPYSAEAVTETTQILGDGNRIARKTSASLYRDTEGRTRREQSLPAAGPWATSGTPPVSVFINDPVAGMNYILDLNRKTAHKRPAGKFVAGLAAKSSAYNKVMSVRLEAGGEVKPSAPQAKEENLPAQLIEGVQAEGTRTTIRIPAGEVGNDLPIDIVSERWYSPELKIVILSKHSDPRMGETVYKLNGIQRAEPSRSLFELPADYTIADESNPEALRQQKLMVEKMLLEHKQ